MKSILFTILIMAVIFSSSSYAQYVQQGKITYERKVNNYAQAEDEGHADWVERVKGQYPNFTMSNFELSFNSDKSIYKAVKKEEAKTEELFWGSWPAADNTVFTDFTKQQVTSGKLVFEKRFLVQDTMRKLQWKILSEIRTIGDYKCRKAVSKICDSVYVVAFYTDDIMVSGGPEMFSGLPGMILELAIPRLHTTWTATKMEFTSPNPDELTPPEKGKPVTGQELYETLQSSFSNWGKQASRYIWWSVL